MPRRLTTFFLLSFACLPLGAAFDLKNGDRVLFLGDTLLEREGTYGYVETTLLQQFPDLNLTVRNLSFSGDTPLGVSRASFDPAAKGFERLKEQLGLVKPTIVFLGYGMAASLQEMTDRHGDWTQNRDMPRYGAEPMTAARFKGELAQCMDAIKASAGAPVRFVLLSPLAHEDLRGQRPGLPDPAAHNKLLEGYAKAVAELAAERGAEHVDLFRLGRDKPLTDNGIHPNEYGHRVLATEVARSLGWTSGKPAPEGLREAVVRKNEFFFHRWRPANETYLFGFRRHEQGRNATEMPQFDFLALQAEKAVDALRKGQPVSLLAVTKAPPIPAPETAPPPEFKLSAGLEISLWAENPHLAKPTQVNWDAAGRLWAATSALYPQIMPGETASDTIVILEGADGSGKVAKSSVFATGLLIPTGVQPVRTSSGRWGCYVGQSTELLYLEDVDGDGKADTRRIVLSGFGTEDTHHLIHTLRFGPDGRLYFNQSIYIHSHIETPHGLLRVNSGAVFAYDPRTERVEVLSRGLGNSWGHDWDRQGEQFLTDGAGGSGINWLVPGALQSSTEGARRIMPGISPGSYPKFSGLELVHSELFPQNWQGSALTSDFRAHKVVRFAFEDLAPKGRSAFVARQAEVVVETSESAFRPIDVKVGPDGALYIADWFNPIINHGEVDFRDPRRDRTRGRIWRLAPKGAAPLAWKPLIGLDTAALQKFVSSPNDWEREQALHLLHAQGVLKSPVLRGLDELEKAAASTDPRVSLHAMRDLARFPSSQTAALILQAAVKAPKDDPHFEHAAWLSFNDVGEAWAESLVSGEWKFEGREDQLVFALSALPAEKGQRALAHVLAKTGVKTDGPWIGLIGQSGGPRELRLLFDLVPNLKPAEFNRAANALADAARLRGTFPEGDLSAALAWLDDSSAPKQIAAARLAGLWKHSAAATRLRDLAVSPDPALSRASIESLRLLGKTGELRELAAKGKPAVRAAATAALARIDLKSTLPQILEVLTILDSEPAAYAFWKDLLSQRDAAYFMSQNLPAGLPQVVKDGAFRAASELGPSSRSLREAISGKPLSPFLTPDDPAALAAKSRAQGNPTTGELIYHRAALACVMCHAIGGAGGRLGPDMTSIGASAPLDYIIESVVSPAAKVKEGYHAFAFTLKDGSLMIGIPSRETATEQFITTAGGEIGLAKADIASQKVADGGASLMPAGLTAALSEQERLDLFAFLGQLGRSGPFDASRANVARAWRVGGSPMPLLTLTDGRLPRTLLSEKLGGQNGPIRLNTRFQAPASGGVSFVLSGVSKAWLDGQPLALKDGKAQVSATAGVHTLSVEVVSSALPEMLKAESSEATFLGD